MTAPRTLTERDTLNWARETEAKYPVDSWSVDGVLIWPLIRHVGRGTLQNFYYDRSLVPTKGAPIPSGSSFEKLWDGIRNVFQPREETPHSTLILISDGVSFERIEGFWIEKFCDPIRAVANELGHSSAILIPGRTKHRPTFSKHTPIQDWIETQLTNCPQISLDTLRSLERFDDFIEEYTRQFPEAADAMRSSVVAWTSQTLHLSRALEQRLAAMQTKAVFVVQYYSILGFASNLAASRLRIPSVDLQHGGMSENHNLYVDWTKVPIEGYALLPRVFWSWSETHARIVDAWARQTGQHHRTVAGGNPAFYREFLPKRDVTVDQSPAAPPGSIEVLLTLSGFEDDERLRRIGKLVASTQGLFYWHIRQHPVMRHRIPEVEAIIRKAGGQNFDMAHASHVWLISLLERVDVHLTDLSASVADAALTGVHSVALNKLAADDYRQWVANGFLTVWTEPDDLKTLLKSQAEKTRQGRINNPVFKNLVRAGIERALTDILSTGRT